LLYNIYVSNKGVVINEPEKMTAVWVDKSGLEAFYERMETWSRIIIDRYIRKRFEY
jgi:predicted NUDIX family phosphoesterase